MCGSWALGGGGRIGIRSFQSDLQLVVAFFEGLELLLKRVVFAALFCVFGHQEGDFLLERADGFLGAVGFDVGL